MVAVQNSTETQTKPVVNIHCDGACSGNPGPGGWAAILTVPGKPNKKAISGKADTTTTNNRMELTAAIEGLKALKKPCTVTLFSDSTYVIHTMTKSWNRNANQDLWEELDKLAEVHDITWLWLSRNSTSELSECDRLAKEQIVNP
ncbi:RNase H family protein [Microcoleus asticus]|uniref:Ribonuclease HI n=1 Tax=Microcoleus asticus IPMA8 TaxID=2563858 RepID=A0ABX2D774_9CYAN|nr:RNase H family protein [Microcoleus asticus]NQE38516.1 Ribonuclease HI [Microcoleus asticus IPMA8]